MSWLRNIQGQLTELANEVLSEATNEVADPESELQVAVKKTAEAEKNLATEKGKNDLLEKRCNDLEQTLLDYQTEMEMGRAKYEAMIASRDQELKNLRIENEQLRVHSEDLELNSSNNTSDSAARDKALHLLSDVQSQLETLRSQKDEEISALLEHHNRVLQDMRETYEEKLKNLEASFPASTSQSGISIIGSTTTEHPDLSAVHDELEKLELTQSGELQTEANKREEEFTKLKLTVEELTDANRSLSTQVEELTNHLTNYDSLKRQTLELTRAYNDLNTEYEDYKENNGNMAVRNQDLVQRIDTLRANLIEYEERYEQCRREHAETEKQLQVLTEDFINFRDSMDRAPAEEELQRMKGALESSKEEGSALKSEIEHFRDTVGMFEEELEELRVMNKKLIDENSKLCTSLKNIQEGGLLEGKYEEIVSNLKEERDALNNKNSILEEKIELLEQYQKLARDNESGEKEQTQLLLEKIKLLEENRDRLKEQIAQLEAQGSSESMAKQLHEALASNSEKTDECEKLQSEIAEGKKENTLLKTCMDDIHVQVSHLQAQYEETMQEAQEQKNTIAEKDKRILKLEQELAHVSEERDIAVSQFEQVKNEGDPTTSTEIPELAKKYKEELEQSREQYDMEIVSLQGDLEASTKKVQELQEELKKLQGLSEYSNQLLVHSEELRKVASEKHEESLKYYNELQNVVAQLAERDQTLQGYGSKIAELESLTQKESNAKEAAQKDLARLKAHLIHMEETTTAEAIEAEKRETSLRELIAELQKTHHSATEGASEQTRTLELRVSDLTLRLEEAERALNQWKSKAEVTEKLRQETADALQSLQGVLREISNDHEKESAKLKHSNGELLFKLNGVAKESVELKSELERIKFDKQAVEDEVEAAQREIESRQRIIEELENQMEDLKTATHKDNNYRIDDSTLRGLFMSYFMAPNDKKPDIAVLLANILQYPKEDVEKITATLFPNGKSVSKPRNTGSLSLTEQFVRFLESESESSKTAPQLPVDKQTLALAADVPSSIRVPPSSLDEILKQ